MQTGAAEGVDGFPVVKIALTIGKGDLKKKPVFSPRQQRAFPDPKAWSFLKILMRPPRRCALMGRALIDSALGGRGDAAAPPPVQEAQVSGKPLLWRQQPPFGTLLAQESDTCPQEGKGGEIEVPQGAIYLLPRVPACDVRYGGQEDAGSVRQDAPFCYHLVCAGPPSAREEGRDGQHEGPSALGEMVLSSKEPFTMVKLRPLAPTPHAPTPQHENSLLSLLQDFPGSQFQP